MGARSGNCIRSLTSLTSGSRQSDSRAISEEHPVLARRDIDDLELSCACLDFQGVAHLEVAIERLLILVQEVDVEHFRVSGVRVPFESVGLSSLLIEGARRGQRGM